MPWCSLQIKPMSCFCKKRDTTSGSNVNETPQSGSDHNRLHKRPTPRQHESLEPIDYRAVRTSVRYLHRSHDPPYLFHRLQIWTQTTVHCGDILVDDRNNGQAIETVRELDVVSTFAQGERLDCHPRMTRTGHRTHRFNWPLNIKWFSGDLIL